MRLSRIVILIAVLCVFSPTVTFAQENMCESIKNHIANARTLGGEAKGRQKVSQIFAAHKYLRSSISDEELIKCVLASGIDVAYVRVEALNAGLQKSLVDSLTRPNSIFVPVPDRSATSLTQPDSTEVADTGPIDTASSPESVELVSSAPASGAGVSSGPGCEQISPWTWCE